MTTTKKEVPFARKSKLTIGFVSMAHLKNLYCKILTPMVESDVEFTNGKEKTHPLVCMIADMETGVESYLICSAIIASVFQKFGDNLVGTCFEIAQAPKIEGKKYRALDIYELAEEPEE